MSPRRRALLAAGTSLVTLLVAGGVYAAVGSDDDGRAGEVSARPSLTAPAATTTRTPSTSPLRTPSATASLVTPRRPEKPAGPVLLVPGYGGSRSTLAPLADALRATGRRVIVVRLPDQAEGDLGGQARVLDTEVSRLVRAGAPSVDVIGYSAGGVVAHLWQAELDDEGHARRIVTLGSPHAGTTLAELAARLAPEQCPVACHQLIPGSPLLTRLGTAVRRGGPSWLSVWTANDEVVTPAESARLAGAVNVRLQSICADDRVGHVGLPADPLVIGLVVRALTAPEMPVPRADQCGTLRRAGRGDG